MSRALKITMALLTAMLVIAFIFLPGLRQATRQLGETPRTEEQSRREVMQPAISTPTDTKTKAQMYWIAPASQTSLAPATVELSLSADPVVRSEQLLNALIVDVPSPEMRTLPADTTLLAFYIQHDGTAIADFSDAISSETPSGILNEQLAVDSITQTLAANVDSIHQLKILIHGQEADTLAGNLDLTGLFPVVLPVQNATADASASDGPAVPSLPATGTLTPASAQPATAK